jgi:hypothetical protein
MLMPPSLGFAALLITRALAQCLRLVDLSGSLHMRQLKSEVKLSFLLPDAIMGSPNDQSVAHR